MPAAQEHTGVELRLLGPPSVRVGAKPVRLQAKRLALLSYLAVAKPGSFQRRDTLLGLLWPDYDSARGRASLRQALSGLRQALGEHVVLTNGDEEVGLAFSMISCDVLDFEQSLERGDHETAVAHYGGPFISGLFVRGCPEYEQWVHGERERLAGSYGAALEKLAKEAEKNGKLRDAVEWWHRLTQHDPHNSRYVLRLMKIREALGDRAGALGAAAQHIERLSQDLDAKPDGAVLEMVERLKQKPDRPQREGTPPTGPERVDLSDPLIQLQRALKDRYTIEGEIGIGGMGRVYLARDEQLGRRVAIKVLLPELAAATGVPRFLREIKILSNLQHPHILPLLESGDADGLPYYVMPYVKGESLAALLKRQVQLPIAQAVKITIEVARALAYAHEQGVVHRDIKPANILISDGQAMVADFGIARMVDELGGTALTETGVLIGTPYFMSPEQGSGDKVDGRSDIYSLGCVLYQMLAGDPPFTGTSRTAILARHREDPVPSVITVRPAVSEALQNVIMRALVKVPADRYATADEFIEALESIDRPPSVWEIIRRFFRRIAVVTRNPAMQVALGLVVIVIIWRTVVPDDRPDPRPESTVDTSRFVIFPFEYQPGAGIIDEVLLLRDALSRWQGLSIADPFQVDEELERRNSGALTHRTASEVARTLGAGRYIRGEVSRMGDSLRVRAGVYNSDEAGRLLTDHTIRISFDLGGADSLFAGLADRLLFRGSIPPGVPAHSGTASLPARQAFASGQRALQQWDLPGADSVFSLAAASDPAYAQAHLWIALVRLWSDLEPARWRVPAEQATMGLERLSTRDRLLATAVSAQAQGRVDAACPLWEQLTQREPKDFAAWYGWAHCLAHDDAVVPDASSPSGWRFRTSYHRALLAYEQAFKLLPSILVSFRGSSYQPLRRLFKIGGNEFRTGRAVPPDTGRFRANPAWQGDSLAYVPHPRARLATELSAPRQAINEAVRYQRELFRNVASSWVAAFPQSAEAREALAIALAMVGDPTALDTLRRARDLVLDPADRVRTAVTEVWMQLTFAIPSQYEDIQRARELADSLLRTEEPDKSPHPLLLSGIATLTGRATLAVAFGKRREVAEELTAPPALWEDGPALLVYTALGGPLDSVRAVERRVHATIDDRIMPARRLAEKLLWLGLPATLAYTVEHRFRALQELENRGDYLIDMQTAFDGGDTASVRRALHELSEARRQISPASLTFDALYPEAELWVALGDERRAAEVLDPTLHALPQIAPHVLTVPVRAGTLVRAMVLRAKIAAKAGDAATAARWARAVTILWSDADEFLQPVVREMRRYAR